MRFLHTSDWHVGKTLRGRSRLPEQQAVLAEIVDIARREAVDAVLVAGDLYDSTVPSPDAQKLVVRTLLDLAATGARVVAIAGNHDNARTFDAYQPLMDAARITMVGSIRPPAAGGVLAFDARSTGEPVRIALLPWLSQRYAVTAADLLNATPDVNAATYDERFRGLVGALTADFPGDAVRIVMSHVMVVGGLVGGGERSAQTIFDYYVQAQAAFGTDLHYVALGHLHRRQTMPAGCPVIYSGSPLAVDFGEQDNTQVVCLVEVSPSTPASVTDIPITAGRRLRTLRGTVAELLEEGVAAGTGPDAPWLRMIVREPTRAGLREELTDQLPNVLEVRIDPEFAVTAARATATTTAGRTPEELFAEFCTAQHLDDPRVLALFAELHDEATDPAGPA